MGVSLVTDRNGSVRNAGGGGRLATSEIAADPGIQSGRRHSAGHAGSAHIGYPGVLDIGCGMFYPCR